MGPIFAEATITWGLLSTAESHRQTSTLKFQLSLNDQVRCNLKVARFIALQPHRNNFRIGNPLHLQLARLFPSLDLREASRSRGHRIRVKSSTFSTTKATMAMALKSPLHRLGLPNQLSRQ